MAFLSTAQYIIISNDQKHFFMSSGAKLVFFIILTPISFSDKYRFHCAHMTEIRENSSISSRYQMVILL